LCFREAWGRVLLTIFGDDRVRYQVQYANPLNFPAESKKLADIIKMYGENENSLFVQ
jgi:replication factor A1